MENSNFSKGEIADCQTSLKFDASPELQPRQRQFGQILTVASNSAKQCIQECYKKSCKAALFIPGNRLLLGQCQMSFKYDDGKFCATTSRKYSLADAFETQDASLITCVTCGEFLILKR